MTADLLTPRRTTAPSSPRRAAHARRLVPSSPRHLDFLRPPQLEHQAPRISGFWTVGFVWNSLDSLVRNEPSQGVTRDPRPIFNSRGPFASIRSARPRRHSIQRSTTLEPRQAKTAGRAGIMAIDIGRAGLGHWDQPNAVFAFWQEIVDWAPLCQKPAPAVAVNAVPNSIAAPRGRPALDQRRAAGTIGASTAWP